VRGATWQFILFSGYGIVIDNRFYFVPYGASTESPSRLKASSISADEMQREITRIAGHGRVLVLLDAFHGSGLDGPAADLVRSELATSNVTVLTSVTGNGLSREDDRWQHGAFTKTFLMALTDSVQEVDLDRNGTISMAELTAWMAKRLPMLTDGNQQLGLDMRFQGEIFAAGHQRSVTKERFP